MELSPQRRLFTALLDGTEKATSRMNIVDLPKEQPTVWRFAPVARCRRFAPMMVLRSHPVQFLQRKKRMFSFGIGGHDMGGWLTWMIVSCLPNMAETGR